MEKPRDYHGQLAQDLNLGGVSNTFATVGVTSTQILAARSKRRKATFVNDSTAIIYIALGGSAVIGSGKRLNAQGGVYEEVPDSLGYFWRGNYEAIATAAGSNLTICEEF